MMKKKTKRFAEGGNIGYTDQEATDLMENNIVPKTRASTYSGIMASGDTSGWTKDELEALKANEAAEAKPARRAAAAPKVSNRANAESQATVRAAEPVKKTAPSPGSFDRNGPIGDLMDMVKSNANKGKVPQRSGKRYEGQEGGNTLKYKKGGTVKAKARGCGIAQRGLTRGRIV
jgi:hypothetical protein